ncbi:DUF6531 domain-containing protein [Paenibacillus pasadenensis]|uniref:RHS repeat-associated core domain-containing protein n=1 Tax=Paenibacillus pasadenensis TaxID=217090 RepID=UPI0020407CBE|nr:RHS repeat-associated core domain-containing protein [Paenibacillus pasadenensis]MCM3748349.1 DUF6531 domain-containing protein [Paenibacillus pasadenensis]
MKKLVAVLLILCLFFTQFPPAVSASASGSLFNFSLFKNNNLTPKEYAKDLSKSLTDNINSTVQNDTYLDQKSVVINTYGNKSVTEDIYLPFPEFIEGSVNNATYTRNSRMMLNEPPRETQLVDAIKKATIKEPQSLYSLTSGTETISTLNGDVQIKETDLTLPGRNGLSFSLTRFYNSSSSNAYNKETEYAPYCKCSVTIDGYLGFQWSSDKINVMYYETHQTGVYLWNNETINDNGNITPGMSNYNGSFTVLQDAMAYKSYLSNNSINKTVDSGEWVGPDYRGLFYRSASWSGSNLNFNTGGELTSFWRTFARNKPYEQQLYPLGTGWSWDIPFIKTVNETNTSYLSMGIEGSYEISGNSLVGYSWKDRWLEDNNSVVVNNERSSKVLRTKEKKSYYFGQDGRLIQISDAYDNTIKFSYITDPKYGKVLSTITDALNNTITMTYDNWGIWLYQGANKIRYTIQTTGYTRPFPYSTFQPHSYLTDVSHLVGPDTQYTYDYKNAETSYVLNYPVNSPYYLLKSIKHPSGGRTEFTYQSTPTTRIYGLFSTDQAYKVTSRKDITATGTYNYNEYIYHSDLASSFNGNIDSFGTTVRSFGNNSIVDTLFDYRKVYSDSKSVFYTNSVTTTADDEKNVSTFQYDEARRISSPIQTTNTFYKGTQAGTPVTTKVSYDDYGNVLSSTDANGITTQYTYDSSQHLLRSVTQRIDASQTLTTMINRNAQGTVTEVSSTNQQGTLMSKTRYENIDSFGNAGKVIVSDDNRETMYENEYGYSGGFLTKQTVQVKNVDGLVESIVTRADYNPSTGNVISFTDGNNNGTTRYEYDVVGRTTRVTHPDHSFATVEYNDAANEATVKDETGVTTRVKWDAIGQKVEEGIVDGSYRALQKMGYDARGRLQWSEGANQKRTNYFYDKFGRLIRTEYPNGGGTATVSYDGLNRTKTVEDATGVKSRETYDIAGQLILTELNKGSGFERTSSQTYNYVGNVLTLSDFNWKTTTNSYDALGRLTGVQQPTGEKTSYKYSLGGNLIEHIYPDGNKVVKAYDELGRPIKETDPKSQESKTYYDKAGNVVGSKDKKGQSFTFVYNNRNHLLTKQAPDATVKYTYDAAGRRKSMEDSTGTTSYAYKLATGELEKVTFPDSKFISYAYNNQGLRSQMTDPFGLVLDYTYDDMSRLSNVKNGSSIEASYEYYNNSLLKSISQVNGVKSSYSYDGLRLSTLNQTKANGTVLHSYSYQWDLNGNIKQRTENQHGQTETNAFDYDASNRITSSSQFSELYAYDVRGNRQALQSNRDLLQTEETNYQYNASNQLVSAKKDAGEQIQYKYNGDGLMVERTEGAKTLRYYYDGVQIIAEATIVNGVATNPVQYLRGKGLIARKDAQGKTYYLQNGHGDVTDLRDSTGNVSLNQYKYDIWGGLISSQETVSNPFQYSGEYWDSKAGLQYLRARWYDPSMGRFITEDSYKGELTNPLSQNLYTYVHNNPLSYIDPSGNIRIRTNDNLALSYFGIEKKEYSKVAEDRGKHTGKNIKKLEKPEREVANKLLDMGYDVHVNERFSLDKLDPSKPKPNFDFVLDGTMKVELKTANSPSGEFKLTAAMTAIKYGFDVQGANVVIYDLTFNNIDWDSDDLINLSVKLDDHFGNSRMYEVQVWTDEGIYVIKPDESEIMI